MNCKPLVLQLIGIAISFTLDTTDINMKLNMDMDVFFFSYSSYPTIEVMHYCYPITGSVKSWSQTWYISNKQANILITSINGNGMTSLKVIHCNFGSKFWITKIDHMENFPKDIKSDVLFVSEAKLYKAGPDYMTIIDGYNLHPPKALQKQNYTRLVMFVKPGINFEIKEEWMDEDYAAICLTLKRNGQKIIHFGGTIGSISSSSSLITAYPALKPHKITDRKKLSITGSKLVIELTAS